MRSRPQRNPVHRFTVDRHLIETAAQAAALTRTVARPDLLLLGALLHDIGKGWPGDHTDAGVSVVREVGPRLGLAYGDSATITAMVRHHLLLPDTATRRDLDDPVTVRSVVSAADGVRRPARPAARTVHRGRSGAPGRPPGRTGRPTWSPSWSPGPGTALAGTPPPAPPLLTAAQRELAAAEGVAVRVDGGTVTVAAPDAPGLLSRTAGVLALHQLDVRSATVATVGRTAVDVFTVSPRFGRGPEPALLRADVARALAGSLPLAERLAAKERAYGHRQGQPPRVLWFDGAATDATVLELRAAGRGRPAAPGHRRAGALRAGRPRRPGQHAGRRGGGRLLRGRRGRRAGDRPGPAPVGHRVRARRRGRLALRCCW